MAEQDSLSEFDFNKVSGAGKYLKFQSGKPVTIRILTKDPVVQNSQFQDKSTGEISFSTRFSFIIWNFTDNKAQIMTVGPGMAKTFQQTALDEDFGANLQQCDLKISPEGEGLKRNYDVNVLRHSGSEQPLTKAMIEEAKQLDLDKDVKDNVGRLSKFDPEGVKKTANATKLEDVDQTPPKDDIEIEDIDADEPIDLSDIPF